MTKLKSFEVYVGQIVPPPGFTGELNTENWDGAPWLQFVLKSPEVEIKFDQSGSGHVSFKTEKGWLSFDRRGVEDSFYWRPLGGLLRHKDDRETNPNKIIAEQLARVAERQEYYRRAVQIPGIPHTVAPDGVEALKKRLKKQGSVSFYPAGFGTGYAVSLKPGPFGRKRAGKETEEFFGHSPLYVWTFDCD